jgi:hypothetical protein
MNATTEKTATVTEFPELVRRANGERRTYFGWKVAADLRVKGIDSIIWQLEPKLRQEPDSMEASERKQPDYIVVTVGCDASEELSHTSH